MEQKVDNMHKVKICKEIEHVSNLIKPLFQPIDQITFDKMLKDCKLIDGVKQVDKPLLPHREYGGKIYHSKKEFTLFMGNFDHIELDSDNASIVWHTHPIVRIKQFKHKKEKYASMITLYYEPPSKHDIIEFFTSHVKYYENVQEYVFSYSAQYRLTFQFSNMHEIFHGHANPAQLLTHFMRPNLKHGSVKIWSKHRKLFFELKKQHDELYEKVDHCMDESILHWTTKDTFQCPKRLRPSLSVQKNFKQAWTNYTDFLKKTIGVTIHSTFY